MNAAHYLLYPAHLTLDEVRRSVKGLSFGEQIINVLNTIVLSMGQEAFFQTTITLCVGDDSLHIGMAENVFLLFILIKYIMLHVFISSFRIFIIFVVFFFERLSNKRIHNILLFFSHRLDDVADGLFIVGFLFFDFIFFLVGFVIIIFTFRRIGMAQRKFFSSVDNSFFIRLFAVHDNRINRRSGISASQNKTYFANITVKYIIHVLFQLICINGKSINIAMLHKKFSGLSRFRFIKLTICINTFVTILQKSVAKNVVGIVMLVVPYERNLLPIIFFECVFHNCSAIRTFKIGFCGPSTKIILHFDFYLLRLFLHFPFCFDS